MANYEVLPYEGVRRLCLDVLSGYGFPVDQCAIIADVLLSADLFGIESHGVSRLVRYHHEIQTGMVDVTATPTTLHETPLSAVWDANKAMGQVSGHAAMGLAIEKAQTSGIGMVAARNCNHYGIAGYYALMAQEKDLIGICFTNTEAIGVPTFGKRAMFGTNPISFAFPADPVPFLYDAATTVVTRGKLEVYHKNGKPLPEGWAVDSSGSTSQDAQMILNNIISKSGGGIAPLGGLTEETGGHKGYGLGVIVDIMTAVASQGMTSNHVSVKKGQADICHFFLAMDYGLFGDKAAIRNGLSTYLEEIRQSDKADGCERIYTHGEKEMESKARKLVEGIPVNPRTRAEMREIAEYHGLTFDSYF